jgi:hypothetical protein|tara:strand:- start:5761 stop:5937 length:177 start_codon:yes stop_codon:yes gene_type:complete
MKRFVIHCTETIQYEIGIEAESASHARELLHSRAVYPEDQEGNEVNADFIIDRIEEIS